MLPPINRLKKKKDFEIVFKKGKGYKENFLYLKIVGNKLKTSRFGIIVSKKFSTKATLRNKIKRRLRELIRIKLPNIKKGIDGVIIVIPGLKINPVRDYKGKEKTQEKQTPLEVSGSEKKHRENIPLTGQISNGVNDFWELETIINKLFEKAGITKS